MQKGSQMHSESQIKKVLEDYHKVFAIFYVGGKDGTRAMMPMFDTLCNEHASTTTTFIKICKTDFREFCRGNGIPLDTFFTIAFFRDNLKKDVIKRVVVEDLDAFVEKYDRSHHVHKQAKKPGPDVRDHGRAKNAKHLSREAHIGPRDNSAVPVNLVHRHQYGPVAIEYPAVLKYRKDDGTQHRARDVRLVRGKGGPELSYLDMSGPIAVERRIDG